MFFCFQDCGKGEEALTRVKPLHLFSSSGANKVSINWGWTNVECIPDAEREDDADADAEVDPGGELEEDDNDEDPENEWRDKEPDNELRKVV